MLSSVRAVSTVAIFVLLAGCGGGGARSLSPGLPSTSAARAAQSGSNAGGSSCRIVVEDAAASGSAAALATYPCDPTDAGQAKGIAVNTAGGYDVLFTDTNMSKDVVRRFGNDGATTVSTLVLDFVGTALATDRGAHDYVDTAAGRIAMYTTAATDAAARSSDVSLATNPQLGPVAVSPGADRAVYVAAGTPGHQSIDALATGSASVSRAIGPFGNYTVGALAVDAQGLLYVALNPLAGGTGSVIRVYDAAANGKPVPLRIIMPSPATSGISGLAVSAVNATLYASQTTTVSAFPLTANGSTSPSRTIAPHPEQSQMILGIAVSADGTLDILENRIAALSCAQNAITGPGVPLASAASFAVLAGSTVTNAGATSVTGDLGVSPGTSVTGFGPGTVTNGSIHAGDPVAAQAQSDLAIAYGNAAGRGNPSAVPADIGGTVITPGNYQPSTSLAISGNVTLDGQNNPNSVFIFQIPSTLTTAVNSTVTLINGTNACNVFWQVGSSATLNTATAFKGTIMAASSISLGTGATVNGRVLAESGAVTLLANSVTVTGP